MPLQNIPPINTTRVLAAAPLPTFHRTVDLSRERRGESSVKRYRKTLGLPHWCSRICPATRELTRRAHAPSSRLCRDRAAGSASLGLATGFSVLVGVTGCMVGPDYRRPSANVSDTWLDIKTSTQGPSNENGRWWS